MRHAACEPAERFHLPRIVQLLGKALPLRNIDADAANQRDLPVLHDGKFVDQPAMHAIGLLNRLDKLGVIPRI